MLVNRIPIPLQTELGTPGTFLGLGAKAEDLDRSSGDWEFEKDPEWLQLMGAYCLG